SLPKGPSDELAGILAKRADLLDAEELLRLDDAILAPLGHLRAGALEVELELLLLLGRVRGRELPEPEVDLEERRVPALRFLELRLGGDLVAALLHEVADAEDAVEPRDPLAAERAL